MVHMSDISWDESGEQAIEGFKKGDVVKFKVLEIDVDKERISLGIKQLGEDPFKGAVSGIAKGSVVTCTVTAVTDGGVEVSVSDGAHGFIRKGDLGRERSEQRPDRFAVGEKVDAKVTNIDKNSRKLSLSIKAREIDEDKKAMKQFGSSDSGASLGDILGAALNKATDKSDAEAEAPAEKPKKAVEKAAEKVEAVAEATTAGDEAVADVPAEDGDDKKDA